jgi:VWFA-related protein
MRRRFLFLGFAILLVASSAFAVHREVTTVEVVQVPVYVSVDGHAVTGLTKSDFELYVNGKRQAVDYFDTIDFAGLPAAGTTDPRQRRLYLLTFDLLFSTPNALARATAAAGQYLAHALPGDVFAVATYTSNHGLNFVVPFTRDLGLVHSALRSLRTTTGDPLALTLAESASTAQVIDPELDRREAMSAQTAVMASLMQEASRGAAMQPFHNLVEDEITSLSDLADRMAVLEGQKHVVLLSGGFDASFVHGVHVAKPEFLGAAPRRGASNFSSAGPSDPRLTRYLSAMYARFTAASVFLDAIDIRGLRSGQDAVDNEALFTLTRDTGGTVVEHENNLASAIQQLTDQQRVVYVLGFRPTAGGRTNGIRVKVRNAPAGADVTYRPSYSNEIPLPAANDGLHLADILLNDIPQTGLSLRASATASGQHTVVDVDIAPRELLALSESKNVEAEALIYIYSGSSVVAFQQKRITIEAARVDPGKALRLSQDFTLPNGHYAAKVLVRYEDQLGFVRSDFTVGQ